MEREKVIKFVIGSIVVIFCAAGFCTQVSYVTSRFMEYNTRTIVNMIIQTNLTRLPSISTCWSLDDVVDLTQFVQPPAPPTVPPPPPRFSFTPRQKPAPSAPSDVIPHLAFGCDGPRSVREKKKNDHRRGLIRNLTIAQLDAATLSGKKMLKSCKLRLSDGFLLQRGLQYECNVLFHAEKYFEREFVCYKFVPTIPNQSFDMIRNTMSPSYTSEIYRIQMNEKVLQCATSLSFSVHTRGSSHIYDSVFASNHFHSGNKYPASRIFYREVEKIQLKAPYNTKCVDIPGNYTTGYEYSLDKVNAEMKFRTGFVIPFVPTPSGNSSYRLLQEIDLRNESIKNLFNSILYKHKPLNGCRTKFVATTAELFGSNKPYVSIFWPVNEKLFLSYTADQELIDFVVYIGSCVGIWFGLSAYSTFDCASFLVHFRKWFLTRNRVENSSRIAEKRRKSGQSHELLFLNQRIEKIFLILDHQSQLQTKNFQSCERMICNRINFMNMSWKRMFDNFEKRITDGSITNNSNEAH